MENQFLWEEQLQKFKEAYLSPGIKEQYISYIKSQGVKLGVQDFIPKEAIKLYTYDNNQQFHLNGRSIFGILRNFSVKKIDNRTIHCSGCSINTGLIQADHSEFMRSGLEETFIEAKDQEELLNSAKRLLNLSNEEMIREFDIKSITQLDIATLFNAIILDPIIDYEIKRDNFNGYSHCWNDSNIIRISTKNIEDAYSIGLQHDSRDRYESNKSMIINLPNGENIIYRQVFNNDKEQNQYTINDLHTEITEVNGNSELLQRVVSQIERFSERKLEEKNDNEYEFVDEIQKRNSEISYTSEDMELLTRQILTKKLQLVLDGLKNGSNNIQTISMEEFELLTTMFYEEIDREKIGYVSSDNTISITEWDIPIPAYQHIVIQLPEGKRICADFFARQDSGTIKMKDFDKMAEPENNGDFISVEPIDVQKLADCFEKYSTNESLKQLLTIKLRLQNRELNSLEETQKTISETENLIEQQEEGKDIGE